jgi:hypothetical protein
MNGRTSFTEQQAAALVGGSLGVPAQLSTAPRRANGQACE